MKDKKNNSTLKQVKEMKDYQKSVHRKEVEDNIYNTYYDVDYKERIRNYNDVKKMKWWHYLISFGIAILLTGLSFLVGYLALNSEKAPDWQASGWASIGFIVLLVLIFMVINWTKNRNSAHHFNDKRRRYQRSLTITEGKLVLTLKILFLSIILLLPTVIATNVVFN